MGIPVRVDMGRDLVELDEIELAKRGLRSAQAIQKRNGAIPAYPGAEWVCSTGMAQLAVAWYMLGMQEPADKCVRYLEAIQNDSGVPIIDLPLTAFTVRGVGMAWLKGPAGEGEDPHLEFNVTPLSISSPMPGFYELPLRGIGSQLGITRERVRQLKEKALARLRHVSRARALESFLS